MEPHLNLLPRDGTPISNLAIYRHLIGRLLYLAITHPDIKYAVNTLRQFMQNSYSAHLDDANRVLRYLKCTIGKGLFLYAYNSLHT